MSDWDFLNRHRCQSGPFQSLPADGFNGAFEFDVLGRPIRVIASDGEGWQHVSVSQAGSRKPPTWEVMAAVKDLFWEETECVVQFHPPKENYVNNHPGCLHLWRCTDGREFPQPPALMVGLRDAGVISNTPAGARAAARLFMVANLIAKTEQPKNPK